MSSSIGTQPLLDTSSIIIPTSTSESSLILAPINVTKHLLSTNRRKLVAISVGIGAIFIGYLYKRFVSNRNRKSNLSSSRNQNGNIPTFVRSENVRSSMRSRQSPSLSGGSGANIQRSTRVQLSQTPEYDIENAVELVFDLTKSLERASTSLDLIRNRSDKDRERAETLQMIVERVRELQIDIDRFVGRSGADRIDGMLSSVAEIDVWPSNLTIRAHTLSVLSDDSFMSALEDTAPRFDDVDVLLREPLNLESSKLVAFNHGLREAIAGRVAYRKSRAEFCGCENENEFAAKVWCLRQAFTRLLVDEHKRQWLTQSGRQVIADLLRHAGKDPSLFFASYDAMMLFLSDEEALECVQEELQHRHVAEIGFWDVVLDFVLIDSFEDLSRPPSAILAVTKNSFLSNSLKESTLSTVIWSMLKAKRQRLAVPDGFISKFYDISEKVAPSITLGFLGTDDHMRELCFYFKDQLFAFVNDVFNTHRVRYTSIQDLADDVWMTLRTRLEMVHTRLSTELLPPDQ